LAIHMVGHKQERALRGLRSVSWRIREQMRERYISALVDLVAQSIRCLLVEGSEWASEAVGLAAYAVAVVDIAAICCCFFFFFIHMTMPMMTKKMMKRTAMTMPIMVPMASFLAVLRVVVLLLLPVGKVTAATAAVGRRVLVVPPELSFAVWRIVYIVFVEVSSQP
jgi:hypothetical protein